VNTPKANPIPYYKRTHEYQGYTCILPETYYGGWRVVGPNGRECGFFGNADKARYWIDKQVGMRDTFGMLIGTVK